MQEILQKVPTGDKRRYEKMMLPLSSRFVQSTPSEMSKMVVKALEIGFREKTTWSAIVRILRCCYSLLGLLRREKLVQNSQAYQARFNASVGKDGFLHDVELKPLLKRSPIDSRDQLVDCIANVHKGVV